MKRLLLFLLLASLAGCKHPHGRMGAAAVAPIATPGQTINFDPTVSPGLTAAINTTVFDSGGTFLWTKYAVSNTAWRPVPMSTTVASDPSQAPGLKAAKGFVVFLNDGTASWIKSTTSDTGWVTNPGGGGGGTVKSATAPLSVTDGGAVQIAVATEADGGYLTASDKTKLDGLNAITPWFSTVSTFIHATDGTLTATTLISDCVSSANEMEIQATGGGNTVVSTTLPGGVFSVASAAGTGTFQIARNRNGRTNPITGNLQTTHWAVATRAQAVASGSTAMLYIDGLSDESAIDIFLGVRAGTSTLHWTLSAGTTGPTNIDTGVSIDFTVSHTFLMMADGTNIRAYYGGADGTGLTQIGAALAQSNAPSAQGAIREAAFNQSAGGIVSFNLDAIMVMTPRMN